MRDGWILFVRPIALSCADIGEGRVNVAIMFSNGISCATTTTFLVVESLRKLVTGYHVRRQYFNPLMSRYRPRFGRRMSSLFVELRLYERITLNFSVELYQAAEISKIWYNTKNKNYGKREKNGF